MTISLGQTLDGKYRVVRHIGAGGMGVVYEGENVLIGRRVAIKLLHAQVASMPEFVERFEREAKAAVRIGSPHVCDVFDLGHLPNGDRFIVMEYLEGQSLEERLEQRGKLTAHELAPIAFELLEGLGTMHAAGVVHRDLKPANIFLSRTRGGRGEVVKILDFGVAKLMPKPGDLGAMTQTGAMMGTPLYMSPEQARGARDVDGRSDIYSASVIFYRALAGELPYTAQNLNELLFKIVLEEPRPIRELAPEVDEAFAEIVHRGLSRDIEGRFLGARAFQEAIAQWGRIQGGRSLSFDVTLPTDPPPRLSPASAPELLAARASGVPAVSGGGTPAREAPTVGSQPRVVVPDATRALGAAAGTPLSWAGAAPPGFRHGSNPSLSSGSLPVANAASAPSIPAVRPAEVAVGSTSERPGSGTVATASDPRGGARGAPHGSDRVSGSMPVSSGGPPMTPAGYRVDTGNPMMGPPGGVAPRGDAPTGARSKAIAFGAAALVLVAGVGFAVTRGGKEPAKAIAATDPTTSATGVASATPPPGDPTPTAATATATTTTANEIEAPATAATAATTGARGVDAGGAGARAHATTTTGHASGGTTTPGASAGGTAGGGTSAGGKVAAGATTGTQAATPSPTPSATAAPTSSAHGRRFRTNLD